MTAVAIPKANAQANAQAGDLIDLLDRLREIAEEDARTSPEDGVTIEDILSVAGRRTYGPLLLVVGLFAISPATVVPGMTWFSSALILVIAVQMALGMGRIWLPKRALGVHVPRDPMIGAIEKAKPWAARIDAVLRPRLTFLANPPFVNLVALLCVAAALVTFPLALMPLAPLAPGLAIVLFGLGITTKDGLVLGLGSAALIGAGWLVLRMFG